MVVERERCKCPGRFRNGCLDEPEIEFWRVILGREVWEEEA
jgi:hypothetical protein